MAADERWANAPLALWARSNWPPYAEQWFGETYVFPSGRGQHAPQRGWVCSGCGRGYSPLVLECTHCPEGSHGGTVAPVMGEWGDDT